MGILISLYLNYNSGHSRLEPVFYSPVTDVVLHCCSIEYAPVSFYTTDAHFHILQDRIFPFVGSKNSLYPLIVKYSIFSIHRYFDIIGLQDVYVIITCKLRALVAVHNFRSSVLLSLSIIVIRSSRDLELTRFFLKAR